MKNIILAIFVLLLIHQNLFSQIQNGTPEEFGIAIFKCIKENNVEEFKKYFLREDTLKLATVVVVTNSVRKELDNKSISDFSYIQKRLLTLHNNPIAIPSMLRLTEISTKNDIDFDINGFRYEKNMTQIVLKIECANKSFFIKFHSYHSSKLGYQLVEEILWSDTE